MTEKLKLGLSILFSFKSNFKACFFLSEKKWLQWIYLFLFKISLGFVQVSNFSGCLHPEPDWCSTYCSPCRWSGIWLYFFNSSLFFFFSAIFIILLVFLFVFNNLDGIFFFPSGMTRIALKIDETWLICLWCACNMLWCRLLMFIIFWHFPLKLCFQYTT